MSWRALICKEVELDAGFNFIRKNRKLKNKRQCRYSHEQKTCWKPPSIRMDTGIHIWHSLKIKSEFCWKVVRTQDIHRENHLEANVCAEWCWLYICWKLLHIAWGLPTVAVKDQDWKSLHSLHFRSISFASAKCWRCSWFQSQTRHSPAKYNHILY